MNIDELINAIEEHGFDEYDSYDEDILEYHYDCGKIKIRVDKSDNTFDIFYDFPFDDVNVKFYKNNTFSCIEKYESDCEDLAYEGVEEASRNLDQHIGKFWFKEFLYMKTGVVPIEEYDESCYGCPGSNIFVGYFNKPIDEIDAYIEKFFEADCESSRKASGTLFENIIEIVKNRLPSSFKLINAVLTNRNMNVLYCLNTKDSDRTAQMDEVVDVYFGQEYVLLKSIDGTVFSMDKCVMDTFNSLSEAISWGDIRFFTISDLIDRKVLITDGMHEFYVAVKREAKWDQDIEASYLKEKLRVFERISPKTMSKLKSIDFSKLTPERFEELCVDLLIKMGFENVRKSGKTRASDGGVDITATEILDTRLGTEKRKIIAQCKHSKNSLSQKDIQEINLLLTENSAQRYVLFGSSSLSKAARERLDKQSNFGLNTVTYFEQHSLIAEINKHKDLFEKYIELTGW